MARQINSRGARYHQDNQRSVCVRVRICSRGCIRQITDWIRLKIETVIPWDTLISKRETRLFK